MRSSPWIRGAPHVGFSATIWKINSRISFGVCFLPTCLWTLEISLQYIRKPARCQRTTVSGVTTRRACFHPDQTRRAITQKELIEKPETRARMSTLQHDELLRQSEILDKETLPPAKEADQHAEAEPDEAHHGQDL
jgi:hypothetical protein